MNLIPRMGEVIKALFLINIIFIQGALALEGDISAHFIAGKIQGFNQTPKGGASGTTSLHRPTFGELNIHQDTFYAIGTRLFFQDYVMLFNYYHFSPQGQNTLKEELITHDKLIPKGSLFAASLDYHLYSLGLGRRFWLCHAKFLSWLEINFLKYHYDFSAFPVSSARSYNVTGLNLGLKYLYDLSSTTCLDVQISVPAPFANLTVIKTELGLNKTFNTKNHIDVIPRLGIGFLQLHYKDNQPVPNHMRYRTPYFCIGITIPVAY